MWAPEERGSASERPKDAIRHIQYLGASTQDPNCCLISNQHQGSFQHPVRYLQWLSKVQLLTPNTNTELQVEAESTAPRQHKCSQAKDIKAHNYILCS